MGVERWRSRSNGGAGRILVERSQQQAKRLEAQLYQQLRGNEVDRAIHAQCQMRLVLDADF